MTGVSESTCMTRVECHGRDDHVRDGVDGLKRGFGVDLNTSARPADTCQKRGGILMDLSARGRAEVRFKDNRKSLAFPSDSGGSKYPFARSGQKYALPSNYLRVRLESAHPLHN